MAAATALAATSATLSNRRCASAGDRLVASAPADRSAPSTVAKSRAAAQGEGEAAGRPLLVGESTARAAASTARRPSFPSPTHARGTSAAHAHRALGSSPGPAMAPADETKAAVRAVREAGVARARLRPGHRSCVG